MMDTFYNHSDHPAIEYSLREILHNKILISKTTHLNDDDFLTDDYTVCVLYISTSLLEFIQIQ